MDGKRSTVNSETYFDTLMRLRRAIQNKRRGKLSKGVKLLHDNAKPHTAKLTTALLKEFGWEVLPHAAYSPDMAPSDYHTFPGLKKDLGGKRFADDQSLKKAVEEFFEKQTAE